MNWFSKLIRKLFLVKEIVSKYGVVHFRRYRLLQLPWFAIYIHQICRSDADPAPHSHPWHFSSVILEGSYYETSYNFPDYDFNHKQYYTGDVIEHQANDYHKIKLVSTEVWTLCFAYGKRKEWGYLYNNIHIHHKEFRSLINKA